MGTLYVHPPSVWVGISLAAGQANVLAGVEQERYGLWLFWRVGLG